MGARTKLNQAYFNGALLVATVVGVVTESWIVFWVTATLFAAVSWHAGEIRIRRRK